MSQKTPNWLHLILNQWCALTVNLLPRQPCRYCQLQPPDTDLKDQITLCRQCRELVLSRRNRCYQCALPLPHSSYHALGELPQDSNNIERCGECQRNAPAFTRTVCASDYRAPVSHWLNHFKLRRDVRDGYLLTQLLRREIDRQYRHDPLPQIAIPVPLHWSKCLLRGFNQSAWITRQLASSIDIQLINSFRKDYSRRDQKQLNRQQRQNNLRGKFHLRPNISLQIQGKHVVLVDDVVTTSATVRLLSRQLKRAGAARVDVWTLARTDKTDFQH